MHTRGRPTLEFRVNPRLSTADGRRVRPFAGPVAMLVDGLTASASECFAGALQSLGRARVFGRPTMGQALPASTKRLPDGDVLLYAIGDFVTATGVRSRAAASCPIRSCRSRGRRSRPDVTARWRRPCLVRRWVAAT